MMESSEEPVSNQKVSTNEFLEFLKITCQVNDSIINPERLSFPEIDYNKLANNQIINCLMSVQKFKENVEDNMDNEIKLNDIKNEKFHRKSSLNCCGGGGGNQIRKFKSIQTDGKPIHPVLGKKLDEVINEGILDSILPYMCASLSALAIHNNNTMTCCKANKTCRNVEINNNLKLFTPSETETKDINIDPILSRSPKNDLLKAKGGTKLSKRKSIAQINMNDDKKVEGEVIIHVCDEVKNTSKDFSCPQHLLVSKMGYFADVTAGQKLEDMDISVHCDLQIFDWLMKWVKRDPINQDSWPQLDATNVVPILVSASFLQMEPLLLDCLSFCHSRLSEVVRASTNLSCLNDSIVSRLASMFTNLELEIVKDKKERVTPRLWTKMIQSLCEPEPQALRGHYFTLGGLFRCNKCGKYLTQSVNSYVRCIPTNTKLNRWGQLVSQHQRDTAWQITNYVGSLFKEMKSWRKVYWKLWGHCHFLYCCICETHFPAYQMNWCQYHPEIPQFLGPITEGRITGPAGRYPCCGQQAFRFETLPGPNGCNFREHSVLVETDRDRAILTLAQIAAEGNCLYEAASSKPPPYSEPRWVGMSLMPTKCRQGLLPSLYVDEYQNKPSRRMRQTTSILDSSSETDTSETIDKKYVRRQISTSSDGCESENSSGTSFRNKSHTRQIKGAGGRHWSGEISARSNQDNQRDFEERVMKHVIAMVNKKTGSDTSIKYNNIQTGGVYVRLEAEWKDQIKQRNFSKQKMK